MSLVLENQGKVVTICEQATMARRDGVMRKLGECKHVNEM
jgi:hypothetical protein